MVSRNGMTRLVIVSLSISAGFAVAPVVAAEPGWQHEVIPCPPDEEPETPAAGHVSRLRVSDAVYRVEKGADVASGNEESGNDVEPGNDEVQSELVRWHRGWGRGFGYGGWGRRGWGFGGWGYRRFGYGGWGFRRWGYPGWGYGYPGWGWGGRRWAFAPIYRPYYGGCYGYPAYGYGYGYGYPAYGNQFAYGYGSPYGFGGYGMMPGVW